MGTLYIYIWNRRAVRLDHAIPVDYDQPARPTPESSTRLRRMLDALAPSRAPYRSLLPRLVGWPWSHRSRHGSPGLRPPAYPLRRAGLESDLLHDRDGALAHERDGHRMGADALARDTAGGVGGVDAGWQSALSNRPPSNKN